jgi:glycosyltransferase involved in cell wall biosynthesis
MDVVLIDDSFAFDGLTPRNDPMGGPQKGLVHLAEALARRGHEVTVLNRCEAPRDIRGVAWRPLDSVLPARADLLVALRAPRLLEALPEPGRRALWVTTPGAALARGEAAESLKRHPEAALVFMSQAHRGTWFDEDARALVIDPGVAPPYLACEGPAGWWPPRAVVTTHPKMEMDWLIALWTRRIEPLVKGAELHLFSGSLALGTQGKTVDEEIRPILRQAEEAADQGVTIRRPLPDHEMAEEYRHARVHLYPGAPGEVYAATLAESQAAGLPGVAHRAGAAQERVKDSRSGFLVADEEAFANCAVLCLKEDIVYRGRSKDAWDMQRGRTWDAAAADFEALAA